MEYVGTTEKDLGNKLYYENEERGIRSYSVTKGQIDYIDDKDGNYSIKPTEGNKTVNVDGSDVHPG